jgi:hypothetical protein
VRLTLSEDRHSWQPTRPHDVLRAHSSLTLYVCVVSVACAQAQFVLGTGRSNSFSYLVGYGRLSPERPQHRQSSCGSSDSCNVVTGLMAQGRNPVQLKGGAVPQYLQRSLDGEASGWLGRAVMHLAMGWM